MENICKLHEKMSVPKDFRTSFQFQNEFSNFFFFFYSQCNIATYVSDSFLQHSQKTNRIEQLIAQTEVLAKPNLFRSINKFMRANAEKKKLLHPFIFVSELLTWYGSYGGSTWCLIAPMLLHQHNQLICTINHKWKEPSKIFIVWCSIRTEPLWWKENFLLFLLLWCLYTIMLFYVTTSRNPMLTITSQ